MSDLELLVEQARHDLPNTPTEIIDDWLVTFINRFGWPPSDWNSWRYILRGTKDLDYLRSLRWEKHEVELSPSKLLPEYREIVTELLATHVLNFTTQYSSMSDGKERFDRIERYMRENLTFPKPVILEKIGNDYAILDGNHRIAALVHLYGYMKHKEAGIPVLGLSLKQWAWVAEAR